MKSELIYFALCLSLLAKAANASAEKPWIEVRSPHFRVLTNGSPADARHVAHEFEQMRYVFATQLPSFRLDSGAPLTIFAVRDQQTAGMLEPGIWKSKGSSKIGGFFRPDRERQFAMVRLDMTDRNPYVLVYHEYTRMILHMNFRWLPLWLDVGLGEFYSYTQFEPDKIHIGAPTKQVAELQKTPIPIATLLKVNGRSPEYHDDEKVRLFYAESWALVHYMNFGEGMDQGQKLNRFFALLQDGTDQTKAFEQVFGSTEAMDGPLDRYMHSQAFHAAVFPNPPEIKEKEFTVRKLSVAETEAALAGYFLWNRNPTSATPLVAAALEHDPKLGLAHEEDGFLLFNVGKDSEAAAEFASAYALDPTLYLSLFAKTMMSPVASSNAPADETALHDALTHVADLDPQFAPVYVQLARLNVRENNLPLAYGTSRRAEELEPSRAEYHLLTGQILHRMGRDVEAAGNAEYVAKLWHGPDHDEAVDLWNSIPAKQKPSGASLAEEIPSGARTIAGLVRATNCHDLGLIVLEHDGNPLTYRFSDVSIIGIPDTLWYGPDHFSRCHNLEGMSAVVRYAEPKDSSYQGDITELELRDPLPPAVENRKPQTQPAAKP